MTYALGEQSRLKLARAKQFIDEVAGCVISFQNAKPAKLVYDDKSSPGQVVVKAEIQIRPPTAVSLAIGDAIHNMRAALDILICDHVRLAGVNPGTQVAYPFCKKEADIDSEIARRGLHVLTTQALDVVRGSRPYKGGNDILAAIHFLDIDDKHKLLLPFVQMSMIKDLSVYQIGGLGSIVNIGGIVVREGVGLFAFPIDTPYYFTAAPDIEVNLFLEGHPHSTAVATQLDEMLKVATGLVNALSH